MDRTEHTDHTEQTSQIRRRPPVRAGSRSRSSRPRSRGKAPAKLNYRMMLCIAVLVCLLLAVLFFSLFRSRGGKIDELEKQLETLQSEKTTLAAQVEGLTQENQAMLAGLAAALPDPTTAQTTSIAELIPQLTEGVYVVSDSGSQLKYLSVPTGYLQDRLTAYRDDAAGFSAVQGNAPACAYYVLYADRVIGLAAGNTGFVSMDRTTAGSASSTPAGMYDLVAAMFA
ncbi:MAG: hypothetical protein Q4D31_02100 [Eubacteriales bacterium]|nr:hypothetical protein [Eubacteriales bacterium]